MNGKALFFFCLGIVCLAGLLSTTIFADQCKLVSLPSFDFGSLDPKYPSERTLEDYVTLWCAKDTEYTLSVNNGSNAVGSNPSLAKDGGGGKQILYSISFNKKGVGQGENVLIRVPVTIKIPAASQANLPVGRYGDQVKLTLDYSYKLENDI